MLRNMWWALLVSCTGTLWLGTGSAQARYFPVRDEADLIKKPETLEKVNQLLKDIDRQFGVDVLVEIQASPPAADIARVKGLDKDGLQRYFLDLAKERAKRNKLHGVYILINRSPKYIDVITDTKTGQVFTSANTTEVRKRMYVHFEKKEFDEGLLAGVEYIREQFARNPPPRASGAGAPVAPRATRQAPAVPKDGEVNWGGIVCIGLVVLLVIWLVFGLVRGMSGGGAGGSYGGAPGYGGGGGGGGFMSGMLGGLFGAVAGNWLYHNFLGGGSHGSWGSQANAGEPGAGAGDDTDYTGTGGSWDDGGGGGGGDAGGGDWGGGGGGGDWGGGGGDFGGGGGGDW